MNRTTRERLHDLRRKANFEAASFGNVFKPNATPTMEDGRPLTEANITEFIRERTQVYRNSWVNPIIDDLIEREEKARAKRAARAKK